MTLREAANVAWHVRVNGLDGVTDENLKGAFAVLEQLAEREPLVQALVLAIDNAVENDDAAVNDRLMEATEAVHKFKLK